MAGKSVSLNTHNDLNCSNVEVLAKWVSCNGDVWGVGPTAVFASAAALFLYNELQATVFIPGDQQQVSPLEKTLISAMMLGMFALMIHLWVCTMRFFQYYLDTIIRDSPSVILEMTTAGLLGGQAESMLPSLPLGPLTRFLRMQQPQIHITMCWFLSLCYADYVRKHYCTRFNMPYLEVWQAELQERAIQASHRGMERLNNFVALIQQRLRGYEHTDSNTEPALNTGQERRTTPGDYVSRYLKGELEIYSRKKCIFVSSVNRATALCRQSNNSGAAYRKEKPSKIHKCPSMLELRLHPHQNQEIYQAVTETNDLIINKYNKHLEYF